MEDTTTGKNVTVQEVGSPVPASDRGGKAGPGTSSSNDRNTAMKKELWDRQEKQIADLMTLINDKNKRSVTEHTRKLVRDVSTTFRQMRRLESQQVERCPTVGVTQLFRPVQSSPTGILTTQQVWLRPATPRSPLTTTNTDGIEDGEEEDQGKQNAPTKRKERSPLSADKGKKPKKVKRASDVAMESDQAEESADDRDPRERQEESEWQQAKGRKKKKPQQQPPKQRKGPMRPNALIIRPKNKEMYSEILKRIKLDEAAGQSQQCVDKIRKTTTGDMLIVLSKENTDKVSGLQEAITKLLGDEAVVVSKTPEEELEIKDIDETTTQEEVLEALLEAAGEGSKIPPDAIKSLRKAYGGTQTARVRLPVVMAKKVVGKRGKIKIGWVNCRIKGAERPLRCYKCWDFGHLASTCKSNVDRSEHCFKCGEDGHRVAVCQKEFKCTLCTEKGRTENKAHIAGSSRCPVFKEALQALNNKRR